MSKRPIDRLRAICLALPEAEEKEAWGDPTFRVRGKIFAMEKRGDGAHLALVQGASGQPDGPRRCRSDAVLRAPLRRPQELGRRAARQRAGLGRGRSADQAELPSDRTKAARRDHRMTRAVPDRHGRTRASLLYFLVSDDDGYLGAGALVAHGLGSLLLLQRWSNAHRVVPLRRRPAGN
jgi:hypothetical protein